MALVTGLEPARKIILLSPFGRCHRIYLPLVAEVVLPNQLIFRRFRLVIFRVSFAVSLPFVQCPRPYYILLYSLRCLFACVRHFVNLRLPLMFSSTRHSRVTILFCGQRKFFFGTYLCQFFTSIITVSPAICLGFRLSFFKHCQRHSTVHIYIPGTEQCTSYVGWFWLLGFSPAIFLGLCWSVFKYSPRPLCLFCVRVW